MGFIVYSLDDASRDTLLQQFPPKYHAVSLDHITHQFPAKADTQLPSAENVQVVGYIDDKRGLEGLIVEVDGQRERPDGKPYHITLSYDPSKLAPAEFDAAPPGKKKAKEYRPAHTNGLILCMPDNIVLLEEPVTLSVKAEFKEHAVPPPQREL